MSQEAMEFGLKVFEEQKLEANTTIFQKGSICKDLFFLEEGTVKCTTINTQGENQVLWVVFEGRFFTEPHSFFSQTLAKNSLYALQDCTVQTISYKNFQYLLKASHDWAFWLSQVLQYELCQTLEEYHWQVHGDATERYNRLLKTYPKILQNVPLGDIASLLGISQVSLSRIRANKQKKP